MRYEGGLGDQGMMGWREGLRLWVGEPSLWVTGAPWFLCENEKRRKNNGKEGFGEGGM